MTISPPESGEKDKKILESPVKADPRPIDFAKLDKPGFWSSKLCRKVVRKDFLIVDKDKYSANRTAMV